MSCKPFHKSIGKSSLSIKPIIFKNKSKRDRKRSISVKTMPKTDDSLDDLHFPHVFICLGCFFRHIIAVLMFISPKEILSLNIVKKIFHSFYQGGKGMPLCLGRETQETETISSLGAANGQEGKTSSCI